MTIKKVRIIAEDKKLIPAQGSQGAAGYDLVATGLDYDPVSRCWIYNTGVKIEIPRGYFGDLRARSSIYKKGPWMLANGSGVIDSDYQGEIKAIFKCVSDDWDWSDPPYEKGDRIAQIILVPYTNIEWEKVNDFQRATERGNGGFGSTGQKATDTDRKSTKSRKKPTSGK